MPDHELRKVSETMSIGQARYGFGKSRLATASQCKRSIVAGEYGLQASTLTCTNHGNLVIIVDILTVYTSQLLGQRSLSRDIGCSLDLISISSPFQCKRVKLAQPTQMK